MPRSNEKKYLKILLNWILKHRHFVIWGTIAIYGLWFYLASRNELNFASASFGDAFGALTAAGASLALIIGLLSLVNQKEELRLAFEEAVGQRAASELENRLLEAELELILFQRSLENDYKFSIAVGKPLGANSAEIERNQENACLHSLAKMLEWCTHMSVRLEKLQKIKVEDQTYAKRESPAVDKRESIKLPMWLVGLIAVLVILALVIWGVIVHESTGSKIGWGEFGDSFGPIASFATVMALILNLFSMLIQQQELELIRSETNGNNVNLRTKNLLNHVQVLAEMQGFIARLHQIVAMIQPASQTLENRKAIYDKCNQIIREGNLLKETIKLMMVKVEKYFKS